MTKRVLDLGISLALLLFFSPAFLIISILIILSDGFPVFFRQERVGKDGKTFVILKFRSMRKPPKGSNNDFTPGDKSRITRVGNFLRKTKLDELPQLINVLLGEMSLVGPRPEVKQWVNAYPKQWALVHTIRPGITDPASIKFRNEEEILAKSNDPTQTYRNEVLPQKLEIYTSYVNKNTVLGDFKILIRTISAVLLKSH